MKTETLAAWEARLRPLLARLPPALAVRLASWGRRSFLRALARDLPDPAPVPGALGRTLWGVRFRSPILNAAGMFKNGEGYELAARQGAGGYLAGTTTHQPRTGNRRHGVWLPFAPYPRSGAASNWLGLPNPGHEAVAARLRRLERVEGCPVGVSVAACPDPAVVEDHKLEQLAAAMALYDQAGVDFLEMNESCPNTGDGASDLRRRLAHVGERFLARRRRPLPVIVKLSCDVAEEQLGGLLSALVELGFDGVNLGNTSTDYGRHRPAIEPAEKALYDHFTGTYGGGVSGRPLAERSLGLVRRAARHLREHPPGRDFHVIRTGGVASARDLRAALDAGASLCQWYSGYFEAFGRAGHGLYRALYRELG